MNYWIKEIWMNEFFNHSLTILYHPKINFQKNYKFVISNSDFRSDTSECFFILQNADA